MDKRRWTLRVTLLCLVQVDNSLIFTSNPFTNDVNTLYIAIVFMNSDKSRSIMLSVSND